MSSVAAKREPLKFTASKDELSRIEAAQAAAGYKTRSKYLLEAALRSQVPDLILIEELLGEIGMAINRLVTGVGNGGPLTSQEARQIAEAVLSVIERLRNHLGEPR
jgi:hypothetical protein